MICDPTLIADHDELAAAFHQMKAAPADFTDEGRAANSRALHRGPSGEQRLPRLTALAENISSSQGVEWMGTGTCSMRQALRSKVNPW